MTDLTITEAGLEVSIQATSAAVSPVEVVSEITVAATGQALEIVASPAALTLEAATSVQAVEIPRETLALAVSEPQGPQGTQRLAIGPDAPSYGAGESYLWVQTGLGDGNGMTIWIEDGL